MLRSSWLKQSSAMCVYTLTQTYLPAASVTLAFLTSSAAERTYRNSRASAVVEILLMNASTDSSIS